MGVAPPRQGLWEALSFGKPMGRSAKRRRACKCSYINKGRAVQKQPGPYTKVRKGRALNIELIWQLTYAPNGQSGPQRG